MKKALLSLAICLLAMNVCFTQEVGTLAQPSHVVAKQINSEGEITLDADFSYDDDGKVVAFTCPQHGITATYLYSANYLLQEGVSHSTPPGWGGNSSEYMEFLKYTYYEDGQIKHFTHETENNLYNCEYSYDEHSRLKKKEYKNGYGVTEYHQHCLYDYENEDMTQTESYWTSWPSEGLKLRKKTVFQYDDSKLNTVFTQYYDLEGDTTNTTLLTYTYTPSGKEESQIKQTLTDGVWVNTSIQYYIYDEYDRVIEQQNGSWSTENDEWNITKKITFEYEPQGENTIYTVSFYKKRNDEWVWDEFDNQTILFGAELKTQQNTLRHFYYDDVYGGADINQFVFTFINTQRPIYLDLEENESLACTAHPNPTNGQVTITGKDLKTAEVFNTLGQHVAIAQGEGEQMTVDISALPAGVYFVNITDAEGRKCVRKVVKE